MQFLINITLRLLQGATAFLMYFFYPVIAGPIFEDMIYRGLVMTALEKGRNGDWMYSDQLYYLESCTLVVMVGS